MEEVKFQSKYEKILKSMPEFKEMADSASTDDLKRMIVRAESNVFEIDKAREADEKLNAAKLLVKDLKAPYDEATKVQTTKTKYCLYLLDQRGDSSSDDSPTEEDE